jgi:hypothetical protein
MSLNREFLIWKEQGRGCERERGGWMGFKVRLGLGEIEGRDRDRETYKQRDKETELTIKIPSKAR